MVKISFAPIFFLLSTLLSLTLAFPIEPRDVRKLGSCLRGLSADAASLASAITNVDENDLITGGLDITLAFVQVLKVEGDIDTCDGDTLHLPVFSEYEAETILTIAQGIVPSVKSVLAGIVEKQSIFKAFIISGPITAAGLKEVQASTIKLANDLIKLVPAQATIVLRDITNLKDELQAAFEAAVKVFD